MAGVETELKYKLLAKPVVQEMGSPAGKGSHPLAGKTGEGPPVSPPKWKWRCGNRISDMYFYAPDGKKIRSRPELASYLSTVPDAPSVDDFCWRVTPDILNTGVWTKDEASARPPRTPTPKSKPKNTVTDNSPKKRGRQSDTGSNWSTQIPSPSTTTNGVQFSRVEPLAIRAPGVVAPKKVTSVTSRAKVKAKKDKTEATTTPCYTFKEILAEPSSFLWLHDSETLEKFLEEAKKLNDLTVAEVIDLRKLLLDRNLQMGNITKYPNSVLRIFVRLLGPAGLGEEPSDSLGKVELADLCVRLAKA